jgi:hypothetical protein
MQTDETVIAKTQGYSLDKLFDKQIKVVVDVAFLIYMYVCMYVYVYICVK